MSKNSINAFDKDSWFPGEWHDEPDEFHWLYKDHRCYMRRNFTGAWCGYIEIPDVYEEGFDIESEFDAHGGITFQGQLTDDKDKKPNYLWIGFDCSHFGDYLPGTDYRLSLIASMSTRNLREGMGKNPIYKNFAFVKKECESLVRQVIDKRKKV